MRMSMHMCGLLAAGVICPALLDAASSLLLLPCLALPCLALPFAICCATLASDRPPFSPLFCSCSVLLCSTFL